MQQHNKTQGKYKQKQKTKQNKGYVVGRKTTVCTIIHNLNNLLNSIGGWLEE
jgi:hypothetical protein